KEPVALAGPVKRTDSQAVAKQHQPVLAPIPQGPGKLAAQAVQELVPKLLPQVREQPGARVVGKAMTLAPQVRTQFVGGEERPRVESGKQAARLITSGTLPVLARHRPPRLPPGHSQPRLLPERLVLPAVGYGRRHSPQQSGRDRLFLRQVDKTCNAAHQSLLG